MLLKLIFMSVLQDIGIDVLQDIGIDVMIYAVNWCVSQWNGRDTMDVINFFISRPGGLTHEKV